MKTLKLVLSILLFLCLMKMPYGYYQLVRVSVLIGFSILGYDAYRKGFINYMIIFIGLALLFQPFFKIALGRQIWNIVDVVIAIWLLISLSESSKNK